MAAHAFAWSRFPPLTTTRCVWPRALLSRRYPGSPAMATMLETSGRLLQTSSRPRAEARSWQHCAGIPIVGGTHVDHRRDLDALHLAVTEALVRACAHHLHGQTFGMATQLSGDRHRYGAVEAARGAVGADDFVSVEREGAIELGRDVRRSADQAAADGKVDGARRIGRPLGIQRGSSADRGSEWFEDIDCWECASLLADC
jgi:hypothetical protein